MVKKKKREIIAIGIKSLSCTCKKQKNKVGTNCICLGYASNKRIKLIINSDKVVVDTPTSPKIFEDIKYLAGRIIAVRGIKPIEFRKRKMRR